MRIQNSETSVWKRSTLQQIGKRLSYFICFRCNIWTSSFFQKILMKNNVKYLLQRSSETLEYHAKCTQVAILFHTTMFFSEELRVSQLFSAFPFVYGTLYFIIVLAGVLHWILTFQWNTNFHSSSIYFNILLPTGYNSPMWFLLFRFSDYINMNSLSVAYSAQPRFIVFYITLLMFGEWVQIPHILYSLSYPLEHYYLNNSEVTTNHLNIVAESWLVSYSRKVLLSAKKT
jgi:hypothetical protein